MTGSLFKQYENAFDKEEPVEKKKSDSRYAYSPFALQDTVGEKDVKKMWLEYEKLLFSGIEAEELIFKIAAKARDMLAIKRGASKEDLGIKNDYPYNKSKKDSKNWKEEELKSFYSSLVSVYHKARMGSKLLGQEELETGLERAILNVR